MKVTIRVAVAMLTLGLGPVGAQAQNLLTNPDFDTSVTAWTQGGAWTYLDAGWPSGLITPGSVQTTLAGFTGVYMHQCVNVEPSTAYLASFYGFIPVGQTAAGQAGLGVQHYLESNCAGSELPDPTLAPDVVDPAITWQHSWANFTTAPGEHSVRVGIAGTRTSGTGLFEVRVDAVYLGRPQKGDLNSDGRVDLVLNDLASNDHQVWFMARQVKAGSATLPTLPSTAWKLAAVDDFDTGSPTAAQLRDDLVFRNASTGDLQFWLMNGVNIVGLPALSGATPPGLDWRITASADFNQDGQADLLWRNTTTQKLMVWTMNGTAYTGTLTPSPDQAVDGNWGCVAALDVDKDGAPDLLWYNSTTGKIVIWYMNASLVRVTGKFATPANAGDNNWKVLAAGDYSKVTFTNLDSVDLVWRNETSGKMVMWYMDTSFVRVNGSFTSPDSPSPALGWTVAGPR